MNINTEIESKAMVTEEGYNKLLSFFNNPTSYDQINFYIDTPDLKLRSKSISLRIRNKDNKSELTIKYPLVEGRKEINFDIPYFEGNLSSVSLEQIMESNDWPKDILKDNLQILTSLKTTRSDIEYCGGLLSIDKNLYSNNIDYEVEFEYTSKKEADDILASLLNSLDIEFEFSKRSKIKRAIDSI